MENLNSIVLEPSTNTHKMKSDGLISKTDLGDGIMSLKIKTGRGIVMHGEHSVIVTESENVVKYVQKELNPITKAFQNAFD